MRALLTMLGALVVLLMNTAGAQEVSTVNYKRYLTAKYFESATDIQLLELARRVDYSDSNPLRVQLRTVDYFVSADPLNFRTVWINKHDEYTNDNILQWIRFNDFHALSFSGFGYPMAGAGSYSADGTCYMLPGGKIWTVGNNGTDLAKTTFSSYSYISSQQTTITNAQVTNVTGANNKQGEMPYGATQASYNSSTLSQANTACYKHLGIHPWAHTPYSQVVNKAGFVGPAYRSFGISYYLNEKNPLFPFTYEGFTESQLSQQCTEELCPGYKTIGDGHVSTPGTPVASTPPCTKADGSTSGNPYDCAPTDSEVNCSIINLPCNFKKLFIPRKEFLTEKLEDGLGFNVDFPVSITDEWMTDIEFAGITIPVGAKFNILTWDEKTKDLWRFYAWWGTFLFLLGFVGVPFMSRKAMGDAARDATEGAALRQAEYDRQLEKDYKALRADDSWKYD